MTDESKSLMELLNKLSPSLREMPIQQKGTNMNIINERAKTHGDYREQAVWSQTFKDMLRSSKNWNSLTDGQKEALEMLSVKISRIVNGDPDYPDHWDDISGYSLLGRDNGRKAETAAFSATQEVDRIAAALTS